MLLRFRQEDISPDVVVTSLSQFSGDESLTVTQITAVKLLRIYKLLKIAAADIDFTKFLNGY